MNLANFLTALRILLTPVSVIFLFWDVPHQDLLAAGIFILAGITDGLDGWAARVRKETTQFGKSFDPFADKVLITTALICLAKLGRVPWWMVWAIIAREVAITVLRQIAGRHGAQIAASPWGKAKTFTQIIAVTAVILWPKQAVFLLWPALLLTLGSGLDYLFRWRHALRRRAKPVTPSAA